MTGRAAALTLAATMVLAGLGTAGAQGTRPMPLAPPTAGPPPPPLPPGSAPSPILTWPGPVGTGPLGPHPTYPALSIPGPLDQQQMQAYRASLIARQHRLERAGVSPASPRYRAVQQQLNQPNGQ